MQDDGLGCARLLSYWLPVCWCWSLQSLVCRSMYPLLYDQLMRLKTVVTCLDADWESVLPKLLWVPVQIARLMFVGQSDIDLLLIAASVWIGDAERMISFAILSWLSCSSQGMYKHAMHSIYWWRWLSIYLFAWLVLLLIFCVEVFVHLAFLLSDLMIFLWIWSVVVQKSVCIFLFSGVKRRSIIKNKIKKASLHAARLLRWQSIARPFQA